MAGDEPVSRFAVLVLAPAFGQHEFFLRFQHREPADFFEIPGKAGFTGQNGQCSSLGHRSALSSKIYVPASAANGVVPSLPEPTAKASFSSHSQHKRYTGRIGPVEVNLP